MIDLNAFYGPNAGYVLELYERYRQDPGAVDPEMRSLFEQWTPPDAESPHLESPTPSASTSSSPPISPAPTSLPAASEREILLHNAELLRKVVATAKLGRMIREVGHLAARIDPLGNPSPGDPDLEAATHGLTDDDLRALPASIINGPLAKRSANALEAVEKLRQAYSGTVAYEDDHIQIGAERDWMRESVETRRFFLNMTPPRKRQLLERLTEVETFERYLHQTFQGQKRFSLEGTDMLIPMLDVIISRASTAGTREVVMGMAHRGRLNVLAHILGKPYAEILSGFQSGKDEKPAVSGSGSDGYTGDVKYHLGARRAYREDGTGEMPITLAPNPSHLEFVNPVVLGRTRAAQEDRSRPGVPTQQTQAAGAILIHGDQAFPGQGIVAETLNLSQIPGYQVGGTIHIITNNQIGFTSSPREGRSTLYASDLAKGFEIPIVHVNADDPAACIAVTLMAYSYCVRFHKDFLIDLVGYRRWGHNEGDEPAYTQPLLYQKLASHPTVRAIWAMRLEEEDVITATEAQTMSEHAWQRLEEAHQEAVPKKAKEQTLAVTTPNGRGDEPAETAVPAETLLRLNEALLQRPPGFTVVPKLERTLQRRRKALEDGSIEWAHAESLALASILAEGTPIRMSGQDTERGTFSQRHLVLHDAVTGQTYTPLQQLPEAQASFALYNSPLSENAVLGFEYGYSMHATNAMVLWEAQFGDFANGAQVIIDQFIVAGYSKWRQTPSLALLLPHGYEGQGPEHSSARLERFLQLCAGDNIRVVSCTTAAQYFHVLRRQAALMTSTPRPLIVMTPKSLLRHPRAASSLRDLSEGRFQPVLDDPYARDRADRVTRLILCSGKVYVDLITSVVFPSTDWTAVARLEELYPFPGEEIKRVCAGYPNLREVVWLQEEPRNMGAWSFIALQIRNLLGPSLELRYVGRPYSASPAEGSLRQHANEQLRIVNDALSPLSELPQQRSEVAHAR